MVQIQLDINYEFAEGYDARYTSFFYIDKETNKKSYLVFSYMKAKHKIPENKSFTIKSRINDLDETIFHLKEKGTKVKGPESYPEGKFAWITDPEGTPIELWEDTLLK